MAELTAIPGLKAKLRAARARLGRLAFLRAFWPALLFIAVYFAIALAGGLDLVSPAVAAGISLFSLLAVILLGLRGWRRWQRPQPGEARTALDRQSDLRPLTGLSDRPAKPTQPGQRLWHAHGQKLEAAARTLKVPNFSDEWRALDPAYLRFAVPVLLIGLAVFAGPQLTNRLATALQPDVGALAGADDIRVEAWITPPRHTGRPPVFLEADMDSVRVPAGSEITLRAFNRSAPTLRLDTETGRERVDFAETPDGAYEARAAIIEDTRVSVRFWGERLAWSVLASPDDPPTARFVSLPQVTPQDKMEFTWAVTDDYGVERLELAVRLREPHKAAPDAEDRIPVPMGPVLPKEADASALLDTMRHRWAGLPVNVELVAIDGAGQEGRSESYPFVLPEKLLLQPLAKAAQEVRVTVLREPRSYEELGPNPEALSPGGLNTMSTQRLDQAPDDVRRAALMLDALTLEPQRYFEDRSVYFGLRMAHSILETAADKPDADSVDHLLWQVALKAEYGSAADALRALLAARRALEQALRDGASEDEIRRLMEAFREAANNYVAAKMAEAIMNGGEAPNMSDMGEMGGGPSLGANDFEDMLNALEDLAETGATDQARQLLSDITNMLENLEFQQGSGSGEGGFPMPGQPGEGEGEDGELPEGEQELTDALERLSDLLREQRELNDDTLAEQRGEGQQPGSQGEQPSGGFGGPGSLAERQRDLSGEAGRFADGTVEGGEDGAGGSEEGEDAARGFGALDDRAQRRLEDIARAQEEAARQLERGNTRRAQRLQEQATRGLRDLSAELADELSELEQARMMNEGQGDQAVDPFGNPVGGPGDGRNVAIPDEADRQRARDILDELRRRYEDAESDEERRYLERLLDRF